MKFIKTARQQIKVPAEAVKGPRYRTARQLVLLGVFPGISEATLLRHARKHCVGKKAGRHVIFSDPDVTALFEAFPPCHSKSSSAQKAHTGSYAAPSADAASKKALALLKKP